MKRLADILRATFISFEMLGLLLPMAFWYYWPEPANLMINLIVGDVKWGIGAALVPLGLLVGCYNLGTDILSPKGTRKILLEWPDYCMVKNRIEIAMTFCVGSTLVALVGVYWVVKSNSSFGVALMAAGLLSSAISLATVGLAKWTVREILGEE